MRTIWIRPVTSYYGQHGSFPAGIPVETTEETLEAIKKELNVKRSQMPKDLRGEIPVFKVEIIPAPWDACKDPDVEVRFRLQSSIAEIQRTIDIARSEKKRLLALLNSAKNDLLQFSKLKKEDLEAPGQLRRLYRKSCIQEESLAIDIEQIEADLAEHELALKSLSKELAAMNETPKDKQIHTDTPADRQKAADKDGQTKTEPTQTKG